MTPVANCTFHSWILYFASVEQREIKATGKQRLQIYTIRPAAPNQPLRQQRSRRGNVRTASVRVKREAHSGDVCVCDWERGKKMHYWRLVKSEPVRIDRSSVFCSSDFNDLPWFKEAVHLRWGLNCLKHSAAYNFMYCLVSVAFFICLFMYDLHHRKGMNIQDRDHREITKSSYQSYICCGERSKRATPIKMVDFQETDFKKHDQSEAAEAWDILTFSP